MSEQQQDQQQDVPSLFDESTGESGLASDECWVIKDLGRPAGPMTDGYIVSHPNGLFLVNKDSSSVADNLFDDAVNGHDPESNIFGAPQHVRVRPSGKVFTPEGSYVGKLLDYRGSPIDTTRDNPGNVRLLQERGGSFQLTSSQNNARGTNLKGHFDDARAAGDLDVLRAIVEYIWYAFRDDITILEGAANFQAHTDRTKALKNLLTGAASSTSQEEESPQTALRGV